MSRQPFNTRWAQGVESEDNLNSFKAPGDVRISTGWEGGQDKDAPPAGQENWWHNRVDSALQDLERKGAMTWHEQAIYGAGAPCYAEDGYYYESLVDSNSNNAPPSSPAHWRQIGQSLYSSFSVGEYKDVAHNGTPDPGWLKSNGSLLLRAAYPRLFEKIGTTYNTGGELSTQFRLPDWRGMFSRGLDDGRGVDIGRTLGTTQKATAIGTYSNGTITSAVANVIREADGSYDESTGLGGYRYMPASRVAESVEPLSRVRPTNLACVRWIRYL